MIVRYAPEGAEPQEWTFKPGELESLEAEAIEDATGWTYYEFGQRILNGSAKAQRAILWTMLRRAQPHLRFAEVSYRQQEVFVGYEPEEVANLRAALADPATTMPDDQREALLEAIDASTAVDRDPGAATPETAAPAGSPGKDTDPVDAPDSGT